MPSTDRDVGQLLGITAVVLTLNESNNIVRCLHALSRVADVVLVDSGSSDGTLQLAKFARPSVRIFEHPFRDFGEQRNWAIYNTASRFDWLLFVDADEFCDDELFDEIAELIREPGEIVGGYIAGRNFFLGRWLRYSTMYPSYQLRLLKVGSVSFIKDGHGQREVTNGRLRYLRHGWRHEAFSKGVHQWISRHNDYSTAEAQELLLSPPPRINWSDLIGAAKERRRVLKALARRLPMLPFLRFIYSYILRGGFLDGRAGLHYCLLIAAHNLQIRTKVIEMEQMQSNAHSRGDPPAS